MARPPSSLADASWRLNRLEKHVIGTEENNWQDGLVVWRADLEKTIKSTKRIVHLWGLTLSAAFLASGVLNGKAAQVVGAFLKGLGLTP